MLWAMRRRLRNHALALVALGGLTAASGCAYQSAYVAPPDGRPRAVWKGDDVVVELAGAPASGDCLDQLRAWSSTGTLRLVTGDLVGAPPPRRFALGVHAGFWIPIYYGPPIAPPPAGWVPTLSRPIRFSPVPAAPLGVSRMGPLAPAGSGGGGFGGGGSGGGGDLGKALVVLAVIALIVLPAVDLAIALAPPETARSSDAIDQVNVLNDLARTPGTPCSYGLAP